MPSKMIQALKSLTREGISRISDATTRLDDWQNQVTGFGTSIDKTTYTQYVGSIRLSDQALSNLYHGDDLAARMIDIVPDELLREGFTLDLGDAGLNAEFSDQLEALGIDAKLADAWRWGRLYGGAALVLGADDGRSAATPLVPEKARSLAFMHVLDRRYLWPLTYYTDPTSQKLGQPETYMVSSVSSRAEGQGFAVVHESRLVLFGGATTGSLEREQNNSWDHSVLQRAVQPLGAFNTGWKAVELLLTDANQAVFKMNGLSEVLGANGEDTVRARMKVVDLFRSVMRAIVVDAGDSASGVSPEEFTRQSVSFSDIPATLDKFMLRLAAAVQIPVTILMGQSPAGMNATGDSDFRWFYDRIRSEQTRKLAPKIRRIVKVMLATKAFNANPERIDIRFPPLWTETPLAQATTRKMILDGDAVAATNGFLVASEVANKRFGEPNGFDSEIALTDEGKAAREAELKGDLEDLSKPPEEREPPPNDGGGFGGGGGFGRSDADDDQPRDEQGRFASTDGDGGSSGAGKGGAGRAAVAHERLSSAKESLAKAEVAHAQAKADHDTAKQAIDSSIAQRESELKSAASEAKSLADEAKAAADKAKADKTATKRELSRAEKENDAAHDKLADELESANEAASEAHDEAIDQIRAAHAADHAAATTDEHRSAADAKRNQALAENAARLEAAEKFASDEFDRKSEATQASHEAKVSALESKLEEHEAAHDSLKEHAKALAKEARILEKQAQNVDRVKAAVASGQFDRAESLLNDKLDPDRSATASYVADKTSTDAESYRANEAAALQERASKSEFDFAALEDAKSQLGPAEKKLGRAARAVKAHEREVKRLARKAG